ncbi:flagellar basal body-associated protein FliL [Halalkalibacter wakoensis JCM 9140]|uniref:Flagellar protein FliL n=1 Tax=Halalkalibacter wakoensis JCM 9140 TaxID=1236970 RepID=W4Q493_9BACI|nr:flagellar basal body-associated FliL family protein [Halalkalibacter wakoensis]GAE26518.1 flagellar basal body-associated protein FliL [Halalkalibacter wakoensis JCM 9140]
MRKMIVLLMLGTLVGAGVLAYLYFTDNETTELDSLQDRVLHTESVIVTLQDSSYLQMTISIETDSPATKQKLEEAYPLVENAMIHSLSVLEREEIQRENGVAMMESALLEEFQELLEEGEVKQVYVTEKVLQ